jgi:radical SAM superfamily enzyme YgiQ (UPF0313 family)
MAKAILAAINARYVHTNLALLYLQKLSVDKIDSQICEFTIDQNSYDIIAAIAEQSPDLVAFSVYIWNVKLVKEILSDIKKVLPDAKLVLGGPEVTYSAESWLEEYMAIDYIVCGGGEAAWLRILEQLQKDQKSDSAQPSPDIIDNNKVINIPNLHLDEIPFPYNEESIKQFSQRIVYYETSRGCPYNCSFCLSSAQSGRVEYHSLAFVELDLEFFIHHKVKLVKFIDRTFNSNPEFARAIWDKIIEDNIETRFHFEINPALLSEEDIDLLEEVPEEFFQFEIGIQSTNERTLKEINRNSDIDRDLNKIKDLLALTEIDIHLDLIAGLPYEDYESFQESFNRVYELKAHTFQPGMLKVLAGTEIAKKAEEYGIEYQKEAPYRVLKTKWLSFEELNKLSNIEHLVNNLYNSHKFTTSLDYLVELLGTPFSLFAELEEYWKKRGINHWLKNWEKTAQYLADYVSEFYPHRLQCFLDFLRWDLCYYAQGKSYPDFLQTEDIGELTKDWRNFTRTVKEEFWTDNFVTKNQYKQALLFAPETTEYCDRCGFNKTDCVVVFKDRDGKSRGLILNIERLRTGDGSL